MTLVTERPALEVADIIRAHGDEFRAKFAAILSHAQKKALRDIARCRTAELGGHVERCLDCGHERVAYNSCRNRHCPKCQALTRARWLAAQAEHLLPVEYFHLVFTLPDELSDLARANPSTCYDLLFQSAAATIREVAANPKRLGAVPGLLLVLHTWGQTLQHHPHVHGVVTGGGLSCDASGRIDASPRWVSCRPGFFLPVRVLSRVFRGKYLDGLRKAHCRGELRFFGKLVALADAAVFHAFLHPLYEKDWVVYAKRPFGGSS
jgi:Transposase zinc-binding domain/Putative transposase